MDRDRRRDELRSARLLLDAELAAGALAREDVLSTRAMRAAVRERRTPGRPRRIAQQVLRKLGRLDFERSVAAPLLAGRQAALGDLGARRPPRSALPRLG